MRSQSRDRTFPEEVLCVGFLKPFGVTPDGLSEKLGVSIEVAYEMMVGIRGITHEMAVRLASVFKTSPEFWVTIQQGRDRTRI